METRYHEMWKTVDQTFKRKVRELSNYIVADETVHDDGSYSVRQIRASVRHWRGITPLQEVTISGGILEDRCIILHEELFWPSSAIRIHNWDIETNTGIQVVYYNKTIWTDKFGQDLDLSFRSTNRAITRGASYKWNKDDDRFRFVAFKRNGQQYGSIVVDKFEFDSNDDPISIRDLASDSLVAETYLPKTIDFRLWEERFLDKDNRILTDHNRPWQSWFKELGLRYIQYQ